MNHHKLKIWPEHYSNVKRGTKTFEIRVNDRGYQKNDFVTLMCWDPATKSFTEDGNLEFRIGDVYPIDDSRVVFSLLKAKCNGKVNENQVLSMLEAGLTPSQIARELKITRQSVYLVKWKFEKRSA